MTEDRDDPIFRETHCWMRRFDGEPCARPATFMGPQDSPEVFVRQWRACERHAQPSDVSFHPADPQEQG